MQVSKEHIKSDIVSASRVLFAQKEYSKVSMREISELSHIGLSNIYNYFKNKEELFGAIVEPAIAAFYKMLKEHHGEEALDVFILKSEEYLTSSVNDYISLLTRYKEEIYILFFHAKGSKFADFKSEFTQESTLLVKSYLRQQKDLHDHINIEITDFFIRLHTIWMLDFFEQLILRNMSPEDIRQIVNEYIKFEVVGWRELMRV